MGSSFGVLLSFCDVVLVSERTTEGIMDFWVFTVPMSSALAELQPINQIWGRGTGFWILAVPVEINELAWNEISYPKNNGLAFFWVQPFFSIMDQGYKTY